MALSNSTGINRYRFYREHKYVTYKLFEFDMLVAKTDFKTDVGIELVKTQFDDIIALLEGHAMHEDNAIHALLKQKGSSLHEKIEADHINHKKQFKNLKKMLYNLFENNNESERILLGYHFYLAYRLFVGDTLKHLHEEETVILPELQKLYSDSELRAVEFNTYSHMTPEQMVHMTQVLFPHMNPDDHESFIKDIKDSEPEKFGTSWQEIKKLLSVEEQKSLIEKLNINN